MNEPLSAAVPSVPRAFRKPSKRFLSLFWGAIVLFTVVPGGLVIRCALNSDNTIGERIALLAVACGLLFFPARIAFVTLRRLWAIGTWKISDEERLKNRAKWANPKAWKRIDLIFGLLSLELATVFTITAAEKVHDLVHSHVSTVWIHGSTPSSMCSSQCIG